MLTILKKPLTIAVAALSVSAIAGCGLINDEEGYCPEGVDIYFKYDYNVQRADMFADHVGGVTVYVFDNEGRYITEREDFNTAASRPLAADGYKMTFNLPQGEYRFIALANQRSTDEINNRPGAKFRRSILATGDSPDKLTVKLDRHEAKVLNENLSLDTLWHGMTATGITVRPLEMTSTTISLVRDTKNLTVSLHQLDDPAGIDAADFDVYITDHNGHLAHDNSLLDDEMITYTPYETWTTEFNPGRSDEPIERTPHYALSFNRLIHYPRATENSRNAVLTIVNRKTGDAVARINLPDCLAQGRGAFEHRHYTEQEFLDREYDYKLDFFLKDGTWQYIRLSVSLLNWSKRIQNVGF